MVISHKHKFIFIKPHKTAGTSVELLLSRICGPDDVITPLGFDPDPNVREKNHAKSPQNFHRSKPVKYWELRELYWMIRSGKIPNLNYWEHLSAEKIKEYAGDSIWKSYLKISIVRNPWDHAISQFKWMSHYGFGGVDSNFELFLLSRYKIQWPFFSINGIFNIDYMIRFEHLNDDVDALRKIIDLPDMGEVPVTKDSIRKEKSYREKYTQETMSYVEEQNLNIIKRFNYTF